MTPLALDVFNLEKKCREDRLNRILVYILGHSFLFRLQKTTSSNESGKKCTYFVAESANFYSFDDVENVI